MDLFSMSLSTGVSKGLANTINANREQVLASLSDDTRSLLIATNEATATISPQTTMEQVERAKTRIGGLLNVNQLELLNSTYALQTSNSYTAITTLTNPLIASMHKLGQTDAWGEEYNALRNDLIYNRIVSGTAGSDGSDSYVVTNYADNYNGKLVDGYNNLTTYGRKVIQRNWNTALLGIFEEGIDVGSEHDGTF